jgi:uncharacterized protein
MVLELPIPELITALVIVAVAASLQSSIGFGFNILAVPVLALLDPDLTPIPTMVMGIPLTAMVFRREREHVDLHGFGWLIGGRVPGAFIGAALLAVASRRFLDGFISIVVLGAVVIIGTGFTIRRTPATKLGVGLVSGITGASSAIGGPPLALLYHRDRGPVIRSSLALIFFIGQITNLIALAISGQLTLRPVQLAFVLMPAMFLGYWTSQFATARVEGKPLRIAVLIVSTFAGLVLMARTLIAA